MRPPIRFALLIHITYATECRQEAEDIVALLQVNTASLQVGSERKLANVSAPLASNLTQEQAPASNLTQEEHVVERSDEEGPDDEWAHEFMPVYDVGYLSNTAAGSSDLGIVRSSDPGIVRLGKFPHQEVTDDPAADPPIELVADAARTQSSANETDIINSGQIPRLKADCLLNTGGKCKDGDNIYCENAHGLAHCQLGRCVCTEGCAGADGMCRAQKNKVILEDFTMRNFRWNTYLSANGETNSFGHSNLRTTKQPASIANHFTLMETPDGEFVIFAKAAPDYAITIAKVCMKETSRAGKRDHLHRCHLEPKQTNIMGEFGSGFAPSAKSLSVSLTAPPGGYEDFWQDQRWITQWHHTFNGLYPVLLQSHAYHAHYIYAPDASYDIVTAASSGDPGDGGLWIFDPPLPKKYFATDAQRVANGLTGGRVWPFAGGACEWDCHGEHKHKSIWEYIGGITVLVVLACLVCCCICDCRNYDCSWLKWWLCCD